MAVALCLTLRTIVTAQVSRRSVVVRAEAEFDSEKLVKDLSEKVRPRVVAYGRASSSSRSRRSRTTSRSWRWSSAVRCYRCPCSS